MKELTQYTVRVWTEPHDGSVVQARLCHAQFGVALEAFLKEYFASGEHANGTKVTYDLHAAYLGSPGQRD